MGIESIPLNPQTFQSRRFQMPGSDEGETGGESGLDQPELGLWDGNQATGERSEGQGDQWRVAGWRADSKTAASQGRGPKAESSEGQINRKEPPVTRGEASRQQPNDKEIALIPKPDAHTLPFQDETILILSKFHVGTLNKRSY